MKFLFLSMIMFISYIQGLRLKQKENNIIIKLTENYYKKIGKENIDEFRNMVFRELDEKSNVLKKHEMTEIQKNDKNRLTTNSTHHKSKSHIGKSSTEDIRIYSGEYISTGRVVKFYLSHKQECSIFINDTIYYENMNAVNFVEHMILHNNAENIDPKGVYSDDVNINFFAFNRKLNIFSVYFDTPKKSKFHVEYDYDAINLIKTNINIENTNTTIPNSNSFIWKILNQNFLKSKENITLEVYFDLGKEFLHEEVEFSLNFTKSIHDDGKKTVVKYVWNGSIDPQEVFVLQAKFPLYFQNCGNISLNLVMIFVGSVFIIFLILMLYIILSTVFLEDH